MNSVSEAHVADIRRAISSFDRYMKAAAISTLSCLATALQSEKDVQDTNFGVLPVSFELEAGNLVVLFFFGTWVIAYLAYRHVKYATEKVQYLAGDAEALNALSADGAPVMRKFLVAGVPIALWSIWTYLATRGPEWGIIGNLLTAVFCGMVVGVLFLFPLAQLQFYTAALSGKPAKSPNQL